MKKITKEKRAVYYINLILLVLEIIALIHDVYAFGFGLFEWYTVDSNVLQLLVSGIIVYYLLKGKPFPNFVTVMHFVSAVGLTVTFLIAAFVLAPEGGIHIILWPAAASLFYGVVALILNVLRIMDGPYFFLQVYEQTAGVITWKRK